MRLFVGQKNTVDIYLAWKSFISKIILHCSRSFVMWTWSWQTNKWRNRKVFQPFSTTLLSSESLLGSQQLQHKNKKVSCIWPTNNCNTFYTLIVRKLYRQCLHWLNIIYTNVFTRTNAIFEDMSFVHVCRQLWIGSKISTHFFHIDTCRLLI